ncbi:MAG TPA: SRPBCC family protein [Saprospiraceae bacterium]|nr:SRPBCC family protein [Saprospiraceae bacterium]
MKALKILLYIVLGLAALVIALGLFAKGNYHIERSIEIDAPREVVFEQVRFFKNFPKWSPWQSLDPNMKTLVEGTDGEAGAVYVWSGNDKVGEGKQTLKSVTPGRVDIEVNFVKPWESTSPSFIKMDAQGDKTHVSWGFDMHVGFPWNGFAMFTDMDAAVGKDYERGLANLKRICEEIAHPKYLGYEVAETDMPVKYYVGVRKNLPFDSLQAFYEAIFPQAMSAIQEQGLAPAGAPSSLTWVWDDSTHTTDMAAAVPIAEAKKFGNGLGVFTVGGGRALVINYYGVYDSIGNAHLAMDDYMMKKSLRSIPPVLEEYITDPMAEPDTSKWLTKVIYFVEPLPLDSPTPVKK